MERYVLMVMISQTGKNYHILVTFEGFQEGPQLGPHDAERLQPLR